MKFGVLSALNDISVAFRPGEVHAVVGENGAGKSTLMNVLAGFLTPSTGVVELDGVRLEGSASRRANGIQMVHQHFRLVPAFSVAENLRLGLLASKGDVEDAERTAEELGWELQLPARCENLGVGERQRIEILKALSSSPRVVIFDEPTAVLTENEVEGLLNTLRALAERGLTVILIAHKLVEVFSVADQITVLRNGLFRGTFKASESSPKQIAVEMVGASLATSNPSRADHKGIFECHSLMVDGQCPIVDLNLAVGFGEVLGIGGVDGNGQVELAEALAGVRSFRGSMTEVDSVGYVPQDRQNDGLALSMSIEENLEIAATLLTADSAIRDYEIKALSGKSTVNALSGGNQQKVVLARELSRNPQLLVVVNPTRGLDVKASTFVLNQIGEAAVRGAAVVLISTDRDEIAAISHRTLYLSKGRLLQTSAEALSA
ncbi:MAG: ATP-binding cassette domain-containing protein [Armatimonadota bacterium]